MARDIDYAAIAVNTAIVEKFGPHELQDLQVVVDDTKIAIKHNGRVALGTRDNLLAALRKATDYENFWSLLASEGRRTA